MDLLGTNYVQERSLDGLSVKSAAESASLIRAALSGEEGEAPSKARDMLALNGGATLYVAGLAPTLAESFSESLR